MRKSIEAVRDVIVIGAGVNGINQLHRLRRAGLDALAIEEAPAVGGTWYWNKYPGARLDSECYIYAFPPEFAPEVADEWVWPEEFADQPTLERYLNFVVDRLDLRRSIALNTRVESAEWVDSDQLWRLHTTAGGYSARHLVVATGILSEPYIPPFEGVGDFAGEVLHTARWPEHGVDLRNKRVGVIGVGSTGIQVAQTIAPEVAQLTVFQRTPNWAAPLNNFAHDESRKEYLRGEAEAIAQRTRETRSCFLYTQQSRSTWDVTDRERSEIFEDLYGRPGMALYTHAFNDLLTDPASNRQVTEFLAGKIASRVHDPEIARKLIPTHPFATKRPPLETAYFEIFNRPNVSLVHLPEEPIERWVPGGIQTTEHTYALDTIVVATGFDAVTGSFLRVGITGRDGVTLSERWAEGPRTFLGVFVHSFPNLFILAGPQGSNGNLPRCTDFVSEWIAEAVRTLQERDAATIEVSSELEAEWVDHCADLVEGTLLEDANSWAWGANIPGKKRVYTQYIGPQPELRRRLSALRESDFAGMTLEGSELQL